MKRLFLIATFSALLFACNSSDDTQIQEPETSNFYALTVGNSWVYENFKYNLNTQTYDNTGVTDSVSIVGTESINGNTYFKFRRHTIGNESNITFCNENGEHFELFRDSLGYLVGSDGKIKFTNTDYSERVISENGNLVLYEILMPEEVEQIVEAGTFNCIYSQRYVKNETSQLPATDKFYYSDGIGLIYDTSSFATQSIPSIIRRLTHYVVQ